MSYFEVIFSIINLAVAIVIGGGQIYIAKNVKDFEAKQDVRGERRRREQMYADATKFIQKYNRNAYESDIYLIPLCVAAYKYNPIYPYRREIYREFCSLTEDVQNEILKRLGIDLVSCKYDNYFSNILNRAIRTIETYYHYDAQGHYYYDNGKYFERALTNHGAENVPDNLRCVLDDEAKNSLSSPLGAFVSTLYKDGMMNFQDHLKNLLAYHKDEKSLASLSGYFQCSDETTASYICCLIAKYSAIYNQIETDDKNLGYDCDYSGNRYMEDLFLDTLNTVEYYITTKGD